MKNDKLVPGMILVIIGAIFLLYNFGYLDFHWENFATLWPLFIVMVGVNLLLAHNNSAWASILKISVVVGGFAIILFGNFDGHVRWWPHSSYSFNSDSDDDDDDSSAVEFDDDDDFTPDETQTDPRWDSLQNITENN